MSVLGDIVSLDDEVRWRTLPSNIDRSISKGGKWRRVKYLWRHTGGTLEPFADRIIRRPDSVQRSAAQELQAIFRNGRYRAVGIMSVLLETSLGDITIDLLVDDAPTCCEK